MSRWLRAIFFQAPIGPTESCVLMVTGAIVFLPQPPADSGILVPVWWIVVAAGAFLFVRGAWGLLTWSTRHLPVSAERTTSGWLVRVTLPTIRRKRRLRREALALVQDIRAYLGTTVPASSVVAMKDWREMTNAISTAKDDAERQAIWDKETDRSIAQSAVEQQLLSERFGGRVRFVTDEFVRLGRLDSSEVGLIQWQCLSAHWIREVASRLEALALAL